MSLKLPLKVIPGASREHVQWFGEGLKVKVTMVPEKGQANRAVEKLLAQRLGLPESAVRIVSGHTSQQKLVELDGIELTAIKMLLEQA
jgi:uncharacterized protein YggU (UPF0235/DUF167 family)